jgi:hypothetical protein
MPGSRSHLDRLLPVVPPLGNSAYSDRILLSRHVEVENRVVDPAIKKFDLCMSAGPPAKWIVTTMHKHEALGVWFIPNSPHCQLIAPALSLPNTR